MNHQPSVPKRLQLFASLSCLTLLVSCGNSTPVTVNPARSPAIGQPSPTAAQPSNSNPNPAASATSSTPASAPPPISRPVLARGEYCFTTQTDTLSATAKLNVQAGDRVTGSTRGTIQNDAAGYYTSYTQTLDGTLVGDRLDVKITTQIEGDTQKTQESWTLSANALETDRESYTRADCASLDQPTSDAEPAQPTGLSKRIAFAPGASSATVEGAVVRGTRDTYLLGAGRGQQMTIAISSLEDNAVFDLLGPNGAVIQQEAKDLTVTLPASGDYQVIVGGTRGNANYQLQVGIR